ncbi:hypothetical protein [Paenibacillus sp. N3.4]|uniref:hypothetical protein n=1 Tax=Paenibacillus sp. N3.4 TaxID=2603222 RepID=UPI001C9CBA76|nr:hypothetical protein [Paenibacillus sp. N3.4]
MSNLVRRFAGADLIIGTEDQQVDIHGDYAGVNGDYLFILQDKRQPRQRVAEEGYLRSKERNYSVDDPLLF